MKFISADLIFNGYDFLKTSSVIVLNEAGNIVDIVDEKPNENVHHYSGCLLPAFINTHCHLELSHLKNKIPERTGLVNFLLAVNKLRSTFTDEEKQEAISKAEIAMEKEGIIAVGDISNGLDSLPCKKQSRLTYHTFVECVGLLNNNAQERFNYSYSIYEKFNELHATSMVLHAPYSVSDNLISLVNQTNHAIRSIHNQECEAENILFEKGIGDFLKLFDSILGSSDFFIASGKNSIQSYLPKLQPNGKLMLVHNTYTSKEDIVWANQIHPNLSWCVCPSANLYIENTLPDLMTWRQHCKQITIGTDSLASNHTLSILHEIQVIHKNFPSIALAEIFNWATINGANLLNMDYKLGSLEKGKQPGILNIENMIHQNIMPAIPKLKRII